MEQVQVEICGIFIKLSVFSPSPQRLREKQVVDFSSHAVLTYPLWWFSSFLIIFISCSFCVDRFCESIQGGHFSLLEDSKIETCLDQNSLKEVSGVAVGEGQAGLL